MKSLIYFFALTPFILTSCNDKESSQPANSAIVDTLSTTEEIIEDTIAEEVSDTTLIEVPTSDTSFVSLNDFNHDLSLDFRYADTNNFLHEKVYDCANCVLRKEVVASLLKINSTLLTQGYRLRLFDCYRPLSVQFKMWEIYPDGRYVANPNKSGSIHNRGGAVDLTLENVDGEQLDMGTDFDHFGKEAHIDYSELQDTVLNNRKLLQDAMINGGFSSIRTEWWHYNFKNSKTYSTSNFPITCD